MTTANVNLVEIPVPGKIAFSQVAIDLHPRDDLALATPPVSSGAVLEPENAPDVSIRHFIPSGHKIALHPVTAGEPVRRYGQIIGFATAPIEVGDHVHIHNLAVGDF